MDEFSLRKLATVYTTDIRVRFHATFAPTLPLLYASAKTQMQVKQMLAGHALRQAGAEPIKAFFRPKKNSCNEKVIAKGRLQDETKEIGFTDWDVAWACKNICVNG